MFSHFKVSEMFLNRSITKCILLKTITCLSICFVSVRATTDIGVVKQLKEKKSEIKKKIRKFLKDMHDQIHKINCMSEDELEIILTDGKGPSDREVFEAYERFENCLKVLVRHSSGSTQFIKDLGRIYGYRKARNEARKQFNPKWFYGWFKESNTSKAVFAPGVWNNLLDAANSRVTNEVGFEKILLKAKTKSSGNRAQSKEEQCIRSIKKGKSNISRQGTSGDQPNPNQMIKESTRGQKGVLQKLISVCLSRKDTIKILNDEWAANWSAIETRCTKEALLCFREDFANVMVHLFRNRKDSNINPTNIVSSSNLFDRKIQDPMFDKLINKMQEDRSDDTQLCKFLESTKTHVGNESPSDTHTCSNGHTTSTPGSGKSGAKAKNAKKVLDILKSMGNPFNMGGTNPLRNMESSVSQKDRTAFAEEIEEITMLQENIQPKKGFNKFDNGLDALLRQASIDSSVPALAKHHL